MTPIPLIIRQATPADIETMIALLKELFRIETDFTIDEVRQQRGLELLVAGDVRQCRVLVAEIDGEVVGMCTAQVVVSTSEGGPAALVEDVVVSEKWQRRGVGTRLLEEMQAWAGSVGITRLQLLADQDNRPAFEFYETQGWNPTRLVCLRKKL